MPHTSKGKKCVYATLEGKKRKVAFKKWIKNKLNHRDKKPRPKNRDKDGNFIVTKNHVSQIMKRRAAASRRNKEISQQINRTYAERQAAEERAEQWNRIFFGEITPKMRYEMEEEERIKKLHEENRKKIQNMPYKKWINMFYGDYYIGRDIDLRANRIRHYWKLKSRRLKKKKQKRVDFNRIVRKICYDYELGLISCRSQISLKIVNATSENYNEPQTNILDEQKILKKPKIKLGTLLSNCNNSDEKHYDGYNEYYMDWANSNEPIEDDDGWCINEDRSDSW